VTLQLLFGGGQRLASGLQLRADLVNGSFELGVAVSQLSDHRGSAIVFGELNFGGQPLRITLQPLGKVFEIDNITAPRFAFPPMRD
jgi:hypothetical protein